MADVTYLINVYERPANTSNTQEKLVRRESWYFKKANLETLNVDRGEAFKPHIVPLASGLPKDFNWSGKMFGTSALPTVPSVLHH